MVFAFVNFVFGDPINNCSLVLAHFFLHSLMISALDFLASKRSADDPAGGGFVSSNTHLDIPFYR